jgi:hypothetical protein
VTDVDHLTSFGQASAAPYWPSAILGLGSAEVGEAEDRARVRCMQGIAASVIGPGHPLIAAMRAAETDRLAAERAREILDGLPTLIRRRVLATYMRLTWPRRRSTRRPAVEEPEPVGRFCDLPTATGGAP